MAQRITPEARRELAIAIVGAGRLGASLALALFGLGYRVAAVASRDPEAATRLAGRIDGAQTRTLADVPAASDLLFLTAPDREIAALARSIEWRTGQGAVHCSGALGLDVLAPALEAGGLVGCFHPIQSFPDRDGTPGRFSGITAGVEAAPPLDATLEAIAGDLGARAVRLEGVDRALYHAAGVLASNDVVALAAAAARAWRLAGLPPDGARAAVAPLLVGATGTVGGLPPGASLPDALTGPVARGDVETVERHLRALAADADLLELYRRLGAELLGLDLGHPAEVTKRLRDLLGGPPPRSGPSPLLSGRRRRIRSLSA